MKKLLECVLCGALALSLAACGGKTGAGRGDAAPAATPDNSTATAPEETAAPKAEQASAFMATIEPTVLVDEQGVKITANELRSTDYAVELVLVIENNSDKDLSFYSGTLGYNRNSVNGYMMDGLYLNTKVPSGKKANETVNIDKDELLFHGIDDIADIELAFDINDTDYKDYLKTEPVQIKTSLASSYDYAADTYQTEMGSGTLIETLGGTLDHFAADEVYNEQGVRIISQAFVMNNGEEPAVLVEFENTSDRMVTVCTKDICLNGLQVQSGGWSYDDINAGKRRVITLQPCDMLDPAYWETFGLDRVGTVSFTLGLEDADGNALCDEAPVTLADPEIEAKYRNDGEPVYSEGGIRILHMDTVPDAWASSSDIHLFLLAENGTEQAVRFDVDYDTISVNGYMADSICFGPTLAPGQSGIIDVPLDGDSLAENGIESPEDIETIELTIELEDEHYNEIASPTVTIGTGSTPVEDTAAAAPPSGDNDSADSTDAAVSAAIPGVSAEFKEVMDSYEAFFDEYAAFMENYKNAGNPTSMMMDYLSFLTRYAEAMQKLDEIDTDSLSTADMAYYTQVMLRISAKLVNTAG